MSSRRIMMLLAALLVTTSACTPAAPSPVASPTTSGSAVASGSAEPATPEPTADALARIREKGLYVGFSPEIPWAYLVEGTNEFTGNDAEIIKACVTKWGLDPATAINPVALNFDSLLPAVVAKRVDMAVAMSLRPNRLEVANATQGMFGFGTRAMVPEGNPKNLHSYDDLAKEGIRVGYTTGGVEGDILTKHGGSPIGFDTIDSMALAMKADRLDAVLLSDISIDRYIETTNEPFEAATPWDYQGEILYAAHWFNKDDVALRDTYNDCISGLKEDGTLKSIVGQWGFDPETVPPVGPGEPQS